MDSLGLCAQFETSLTSDSKVIEVLLQQDALSDVQLDRVRPLMTPHVLLKKLAQPASFTSVIFHISI